MRRTDNLLTQVVSRFIFVLVKRKSGLFIIGHASQPGDVLG